MNVPMKFVVCLFAAIALVGCKSQSQKIVEDSGKGISVSYGDRYEEVGVDHYYLVERGDDGKFHPVTSDDENPADGAEEKERKKVYLLQIGPYYHEVWDCGSDEKINEIIEAPNNIIKNILYSNIPANYDKKKILGRARLSCLADDFGELALDNRDFYMDGNKVWAPTGGQDEFYSFDFDASCLKSLMNDLFKTDIRLEYWLVNQGQPATEKGIVSLQCDPLSASGFKLYYREDGRMKWGYYLVAVYQPDAQNIPIIIYQVDSTGPWNKINQLREYFGIESSSLLAPYKGEIPQNKVFYDFCLDPTRGTCQFEHCVLSGSSCEVIGATSVTELNMDTTGDQFYLNPDFPGVGFYQCDSFLHEALGLARQQSAFDEREWIEHTNTRLMLEEMGFTTANEPFICPHSQTTESCSLSLGDPIPDSDSLGVRFTDADLSSQLSRAKSRCGQTKELVISLNNNVTMDRSSNFSLWMGGFHKIRIRSNNQERYRFEVVEHCEADRCDKDNTQSVFLLTQSSTKTERLLIERVDFTYRAVDESAGDDDSQEQRDFFKLYMNLFEVNGSSSSKIHVVLQNMSIGSTEAGYEYLSYAIRGKQVRLFAHRTNLVGLGAHARPMKALVLEDSLVTLLNQDSNRCGAINLSASSNSGLFVGGSLSGLVDYSGQTKVIFNDVVIVQQDGAGLGLSMSPIFRSLHNQTDHGGLYHIKLTGDTKVHFRENPAVEPLVEFYEPTRLVFMRQVQFFDALGQPFAFEQVPFCNGQGSVKAMIPGMEPEFCQ